MLKVSAADPSTGTYDVDAIAELLGCSTRHVRRMADSGAAPRPLHIGRLIRWRKADIDGWLAAGCPSCRPASKARAS
jgi:excisionase family DNA binding protein